MTQNQQRIATINADKFTPDFSKLDSKDMGRSDDEPDQRQISKKITSKFIDFNGAESGS